MQEAVLAKRIVQGYGLELRPVTFEDIELLRQWSNTPLVQKMFGHNYITPEQQFAWYQKIQDNSREAHWVVYVQGVPTGYVGLIGEGPLEQQEDVTAEMYVADSPVRHALLGIAIGLVIPHIVFEIFSIPKIKALVHYSNQMKKFNLQLGYQEEGQQDDFVEMTLIPADYYREKTKFARFFPNCEIFALEI